MAKTVFEDRVQRPKMRGIMSFWDCRRDRATREWIWTPYSRQSNQIQDGWRKSCANAWGIGLNNYRINMMYLEFQNVLDPDDAVSIPSFLPSEGTEYYDGLASTIDRDFIRVPFVSTPTFDEVTGTLAYFAMSQGSEGVFGKTFSHAVNSKFCGAALIATPEIGDRTQDIVVARSYAEVSGQLVKAAGKSVMASWQIMFN